MANPPGGPPVSLAEIEAARRRLAGMAFRTPLLPLEAASGGATIYAKLETLQPVGSFKIRGAASLLTAAGPSELSRGVWTASAGNMAQGAAWCARRLGVPCRVVMPETAPAAKVDAVRALGAEVVLAPYDRYLEVFSTRAYPGMEGLFVHPFDDPRVMAGNGTIALEILEELPGVDALLVPYGGGGLACGIASAIRALRPEARVHPVEVETAAPLSASWAAGRPVSIPYVPSFVDGIGSPRVFPGMWEAARRLLDEPITVSLEEIALAIRLLVRRLRVTAEGAGAASPAAALSGRAGSGVIACVVSGGSIDPGKLGRILQGEIP